MKIDIKPKNYISNFHRENEFLGTADLGDPHVSWQQGIKIKILERRISKVSFFLLGALGVRLKRQHFRILNLNVLARICSFISFLIC